jgi:hypothetical protein
LVCNGPWRISVSMPSRRWGDHRGLDTREATDHRRIQNTQPVHTGAAAAEGKGARHDLIVQSKRLDGSLVSLDGTLIPSQEFMEQTGYSGKDRVVGTKLSRLVDRAGTPLAISVAPGNYHDGGFGFLTLANIYQPPPIQCCILPDAAKSAEPTLLADKGYDSLRFRCFV